MSRTLVETPITTRSARARLRPGVYWKGIDPDVHLGYRRGKNGGMWLVRWRAGKGYRQQAIGVADDIIIEGTLSYEEAHKSARGTVAEVRRQARPADMLPLLTVRRAVEDYLGERDLRESRRAGRLVRSDATQRLGRYLLGQGRSKTADAPPAAPLAEMKLNDITESDLLAWRKALPDTLKETTVRRLVNDLKAALNVAASTHRESLLPTTATVIKNGLRGFRDAGGGDSVARENQILTDEQISLLLMCAKEVDEAQNWDGDLYRIIALLAATGARFSQVTRMRVRDCQFDQSRLQVPKSRKGIGQRDGTISVPVGSDILNVLEPTVRDSLPDEPLLSRWRHKQVGGPVQWERVGRSSWASASELVRPWSEVRVRAQLEHVVPYSLRHSSIVRGLRANLPIRLVAALHDTSVAMIERHYARWIVDGLDELAARAVVPLIGKTEQAEE